MNDRAELIKSIHLPIINYSYINENLMYVKSQSIYSSEQERNSRQTLMRSKNQEVILLAKKAHKFRKMEFVAFAAIPLGLASALCIRQNNFGGAWTRPAGLTFLAASLTCIVVSPIACNRKSANYKKAVRLYNAQF
jgi:hypothetical protein